MGLMHRSVVVLFLVVAIHLFPGSAAWSQTAVIVGNQSGSNSPAMPLSEFNGVAHQSHSNAALQIFRYLFARFPIVECDEGPCYEVKASWGGSVRISYKLSNAEALARLQAYYNHPLPGLPSAEIGPLLDLLEDRPNSARSNEVSRRQLHDETSGQSLYTVQVRVQSPIIPDPPVWGYAVQGRRDRYPIESERPQPPKPEIEQAQSPGEPRSMLLPETLVGKVHNPKRPFGTERLGTAWCLDAQCSLVVTNYHVARFVGDKAVVKGERAIKEWMATGPDDADARPMQLFGETYRLNVVRDLAILQLKKPLLHKGMHGVPFFSGELKAGESVTILGYPNGMLSRTTGRFRAVIDEGTLEFDLDTPLAPGCSGALILNDHNEAVGVLFALASSRHTALAVPVWSLAEFIKQVNPKLYADLFPVAPRRVDQARTTTENKSVEVTEAVEQALRMAAAGM